MESFENINKQLQEHFSFIELEVDVPALELNNKARQIVLARKKHVLLSTDIFTHIANFLNLKIKLYHAVIAVLVVFFSFLAFNSSPNLRKINVQSELPEQNLVAVKNSTVLSCIQTFVSSQ